MNKELISKCCHKYIIEQWFCGKRNYVCSGCNNQDCEVIEEPIPQPIQKEGVKYFWGKSMAELELENKIPTPSDTFIETEWKTLSELIMDFYRGDADFEELKYQFKSSLQSQRQSILEEIEKELLEDLQHDKNHFCKHYGEQFKECVKCYVERKFKELK